MTDEGEVRKEELLVGDTAEFWLFVFVLPLITARQSINTATVWTSKGCWRIADTTRRVGASLTRKTTTTKNHRRMTHAPNMAVYLTRRTELKVPPALMPRVVSTEAMKRWQSQESRGER